MRLDDVVNAMVDAIADRIAEKMQDRLAEAKPVEKESKKKKTVKKKTEPEKEPEKELVKKAEPEKEPEKEPEITASDPFAEPRKLLAELAKKDRPRAVKLLAKYGAESLTKVPLEKIDEFMEENRQILEEL